MGLVALAAIKIECGLEKPQLGTISVIASEMLLETADDIETIKREAM